MYYYGMLVIILVDLQPSPGTLCLRVRLGVIISTSSDNLHVLEENLCGYEKNMHWDVSNNQSPGSGLFTYLYTKSSTFLLVC